MVHETDVLMLTGLLGLPFARVAVVTRGSLGAVGATSP